MTEGDGKTSQTGMAGWVRRTFSTVFDPFGEAKGPPPQTLWAFWKWAMGGGWPAVWLAVVASMIVGALEAVGGFLIGWVIDYAISQPRETLFVENWPVLLAVFS